MLGPSVRRGGGGMVWMLLKPKGPKYMSIKRQNKGGPPQKKVKVVKNTVKTKSKTKVNKSATKWERVGGKPVLYRPAATVLALAAVLFQHKLLCDGLVFNLGDACNIRCVYCYVETVILKLVAKLINAFNRNNGTHFGFQDFVIRRKDSIKVLERQLLHDDGSPRYKTPGDERVVFTSTLVDPAGTMDIVRETAAACLLILKYTNWQIRILSKSTLLVKLITDELIPKEYHHRLILGFSIGTLDDKVAKAIEIGASPASLRIEALKQLQDLGIRTFVMVCPSLPQKDYDGFVRQLIAKIDISKLEHFYGEVMNVRGKSRTKTLEALEKAGLVEEAELFKQTFGLAAMKSLSSSGGKKSLRAAIDAVKGPWEHYARQTFLAYCKHIPASKLRFLQYVKKDTVQWWADQRPNGAVPLGKIAVDRMVLKGGLSSPLVPLPELTEDDLKIRKNLEGILHKGMRSSLETTLVLDTLYSHKDGALWKGEHFSFDDYCNSIIRCVKQHGHRLRHVGGFIKSVAKSKGIEPDTNGLIPLDQLADVIPLSPGQIRPLLESVPDEHQLACWESILKKNKIEDLTGAVIGELSTKFLKDKKITPRGGVAKKESKQKPNKTPLDKAIAALENLRVAVAVLPTRIQFENYLKGISWLLKRKPEEGEPPAERPVPNKGCCGNVGNGNVENA